MTKKDREFKDSDFIDSGPGDKNFPVDLERKMVAVRETCHKIDNKGACVCEFWNPIDTFSPNWVLVNCKNCLKERKQ